MSITSSEFFKGKRPWSKIKDQILGSYLPPYLLKIKTLKKDIIIVDGFAGPGKFEDNSIGSPLMICSIAQKHLANNFKAILVNKEKTDHEKLTDLVKDYINLGCAYTIHGEAEDLLNKMKELLKGESILVYLDQFGISGFKFDTLLPYLSRQKKYSTELILNISVPIIHRLSAKNNQNSIDTNILANRKILTEVFGGEYWKEYLFNHDIDPNEQIEKLMAAYKNRLANYLDYVGYCPVFERDSRSILKYYIFFASRHQDAALLMNDIMFNAYLSHIWQNLDGTLFADQARTLNLPCNYYTELNSLIIKYLKNRPLSRIQLWSCIINECFMKFSSSDFKKAIKNLISSNKISFTDVKGTGRLNDDSILKLR